VGDQLATADVLYTRGKGIKLAAKPPGTCTISLYTVPNMMSGGSRLVLLTNDLVSETKKKLRALLQVSEEECALPVVEEEMIQLADSESIFSMDSIKWTHPDASGHWHYI
jgi:hypothetical protein